MVLETNILVEEMMIIDIIIAVITLLVFVVIFLACMDAGRT